MILYYFNLVNYKSNIIYFLYFINKDQIKYNNCLFEVKLYMFENAHYQTYSFNIVKRLLFYKFT